MRSSNSLNELALLALRSPNEMKQRGLLAIVMMLRSTAAIIDHFRYGENLSIWYEREIQPRLVGLHNLQISVTETDRP